MYYTFHIGNQHDLRIPSERFDKTYQALFSPIEKYDCIHVKSDTLIGQIFNQEIYNDRDRQPPSSPTEFSPHLYISYDDEVFDSPGQYNFWPIALMYDRNNCFNKSTREENVKIFYDMHIGSQVFSVRKRRFMEIYMGILQATDNQLRGLWKDFFQLFVNQEENQIHMEGVHIAIDVDTGYETISSLVEQRNSVTYQGTCNNPDWKDEFWMTYGLSLMNKTTKG